MKKMSRRSFIETSAIIGTSGLVSAAGRNDKVISTYQRYIKDNISLAQWALVDEVKSGKWKTLDFPKIARQDFGLDGIEFVNTLFEVPTQGYLDQLKKNAEDNGVTMVLIMVDDEGDGCSASLSDRVQFAINHRKWVDIAHYLGCQTIRTNCRGPKGVDKEEALKWSVDTYQMLLEYAGQAKIKVLIENHGGISNDADWMIRLFNTVNNPYFGSYPDWRRPSGDFDNIGYLTKMLPYAYGMSYRNQPTEELTAKMIKLAKDSGYRGWYGIESSGREEIKKGIQILTKYL